jgi:hypothetical protein
MFQFLSHRGFSVGVRPLNPHLPRTVRRSSIGTQIAAKIVDSSWVGFSKLEFVPETRVAMALSEKYEVGLEEYDDFGSVSHFLPAAKQSHQLFAVVDIYTKGIGIEAGVGAGFTSVSNHWVFKLILSRDL